MFNEKMLFRTGCTVMTRGVHELVCKQKSFAEFCSNSFARYLLGDWGDVCQEDKQSNDEAVKGGDRIVAAYDHPENPDWNIWIITEYDRSATTILFPSEY